MPAGYKEKLAGLESELRARYGVNQKYFWNLHQVPIKNIKKYKKYKKYIFTGANTPELGLNPRDYWWRSITEK